MSGNSQQPESGQAWRDEVKARAAELDRLVEAWLVQVDLQPDDLTQAYRAQSRHPALQATVQALLAEHPAAAAYFSEEGLLLDDVMPPVAHWAADEDVPLPSRTSIPALQRRIGRTV